MEIAKRLPQKLVSNTPSTGSELPSRLQNFFRKYPPALYAAKITGVTLPLTRHEAKLARLAEKEQQQQQEVLQKEQRQQRPTSKPSSTPAAPPPTTSESPIPQPSILDVTSPPPPPTTPTTSRDDRFPPNPFLPFRNPNTGRWSGARVGLRQQADIVKLAKKYGVEALLPAGRKSSAFKEARTLQRGLRVKGTGEGERVKGHLWERRMPALLEKRRQALIKMPELVREWERRGHGRGWKDWPKAKTK